MMHATLTVRRGSGDDVEVEVLAAQAGLHPALVRRMLRLGALDGPGGANGHVPVIDMPARLARIGRLRRDLGVNLTGAVLACQLLARIDELEARLRRLESESDRPR
jgi:hypothetical protein